MQIKYCHLVHFIHYILYTGRVKKSVTVLVNVRISINPFITRVLIIKLHLFSKRFVLYDFLSLHLQPFLNNMFFNFFQHLYCKE